MRLLITGITSPVGRLLAARFSRSDQVVGLSRRGERLPGTSAARGDLRDTTSVIAAAAGCQAILHCAVPAGPGAEETLAAAPGALLAAIEREGVSRLVVLGAGAGWGALGGETAWSRAVRDGAETLVRAAAERGVHAVCLAPGLSAGLARALDTPPGQLPGGALSITSPRDLAGAVEGALWRGRPGDCYALVGHRVTPGALPGLLRGLGLPAAGGPGLGPWLERGCLPELAPDERAAEVLGWWTRSLERTLLDAA